MPEHRTAWESGGTTHVIEVDPPRRELWHWLLVPLVLAVAGAVGALLAVRANSRSGSTETALALTVAAAPTTTAAAVSLAPAAATVTIPDLRGEKISEVRKVLRGDGLVIEERQVPSELRKQTVVAQSPAPGTTAERGDQVVVNVSLGSKEHGVPPENGRGARQDRAGHGHGRGKGHNR